MLPNGPMETLSRQTEQLEMIFLMHSRKNKYFIFDVEVKRYKKLPI